MPRRSAADRKVSVHGLLLAAGAGTRMGTPKALVHDSDGTSWLRRSVAVLRDGGCAAVTVVLGAAAENAAELLVDLDVSVVVTKDWSDGMSASLRAGLAALGPGASSVLIGLVDLPDVTAGVVGRVVAAGSSAGAGTLARATYDGRPGHPVLVGRDHWAGVLDSLSGDEGARGYLDAAGADVVLVECGDLATGRDVDSKGRKAPS